MSNNTKTSTEPRVNYADHAKIQRTGFIQASRLSPADSDAHNTILSTFRSESLRAPNYDIQSCYENIVDIVRQWETDFDNDDLFEFPSRPDLNCSRRAGGRR